ncbi:MAG: hypothetical protein CL610_11830 [Anaerolineaceae bacterium]|nr:hypothetical protein [Anaerolineaceae bacterium]
MSTTAQAPTRPVSTRLTRYLDSGLLLTLLLCLFTIWPLVQQPGLPNGTDTLYHIYRVAEMDRAWSHGVLMPGWAETFYYGYGSPVFHYYASLTYYITSALARLLALDPVDSLRVLTTLAMLLAGGGMYLFMRDSISKLAGVIAALVYVYSPYILFTEPYTRGAYPELMALALFPLVMWRYQRLLQTGSGLALMLAALSSGLLIITHNLMALVLTGLLAAWLVWQGITARFFVRAIHESPLRYVVLSLGALIGGVGLAGYFWLPVMLEQEAARLGNLTAVAQLDFRNFFVPLAELLAFSPRSDAGAVNGLLHQLNLGVAQWGLALAGIAGVVWWTQRAASLQRQIISWVGFFALVTLALIFLMLPVSAFLWEATAPLAFLQFPWRFLGPAAFCLAVLAGMNAVWLERLPAKFGTPLIVLTVVLPLALAMPTLYVDEWEHTAVDTSVAAYHAAELSGLQRATTFSDEYLPSTVIAEPSANADLLADYADGYPIDKANRAALPPGVDLTALDHGPQQDQWRVSSGEAFTLEVLTYYFPGWQAEIDGQAVAVRPSEPHGLITFEVHAGDHTIRLFFGATPARDMGKGVSAAAAVVLIGLALMVTRQGTTHSAPTRHQLSPVHRAAVIAGGVIQLVLMLVFMREGGAWVNSPPGQAQVAQNQVVYNLGESIQLLGYDLNSRTFRPGDRLELTVYWYGRERVAYGYATFVHVAAGGPPLAQADAQNPAGRPTIKWTPVGYIRDPYLIMLPQTMPPGEYQLTVGMYTCDTRPPGECGNGDRLLVTDENGAPLGDSVPLTTITVR